MVIEKNRKQIHISTIKVVEEGYVRFVPFPRKNSEARRILNEADKEGKYQIRKDRKTKGKVESIKYNSDLLGLVPYKVFLEEGKPTSLVERMVWEHEPN